MQKLWDYLSPGDEMCSISFWGSCQRHLVNIQHQTVSNRRCAGKRKVQVPGVFASTLDLCFGKFSVFERRSFPPPDFVEGGGGREQSVVLLTVNKHPVELTHVLFCNSFQQGDEILSWEERNWLWIVWLLPQAVVRCQEPHRAHLPLFGTLTWCSERT